ncbi:MAG: lysophospholipid acyltransferase family protein [Chloroflexota bacterium]
MSTEFVQALIDPRIFKRYFIQETPFHRVVQSIFAPLFSTFVLDVQAQGVENIPTEGAVILAINHVSMYDVLPLQIILPNRPIFYMAKEELFRNFITDILFRHLCAFPVYRNGGDIWAMSFALQVLKNKQVLAVFPEGTRSRGRGLGDGKSGAARLAIKAQCPVVPIALDGTQHVFDSFPQRTPVTVNIGNPIYPETEKDSAILTQRIMSVIASMLPNE